MSYTQAAQLSPGTVLASVEIMTYVGEDVFTTGGSIIPHTFLRKLLGTEPN